MTSLFIDPIERAKFKSKMADLIEKEQEAFFHGTAETKAIRRDRKLINRFAEQLLIKLGEI